MTHMRGPLINVIHAKQKNVGMLYLKVTSIMNCIFINVLITHCNCLYEMLLLNVHVNLKLQVKIKCVRLYHSYKPF